MGVLIEMAARNTVAMSEPKQDVKASAPRTDLSVWMSAPKERTAAYFPTYTSVSRAMQTAMREWVREWFTANPEVLLRPHTAYPILVFQCTHPFSGRTTAMFTYDIQQTEALDRAFKSAACKLGRELKGLDTRNMAWFTREHYFAYRSKEVIKYVIKNRRALYRMLNVETMIMDAILKFALIDIPKVGLDEALVIVRRTFNLQLRRFSDEFDLSSKAEELLRIMTDALVGKQALDTVVDHEEELSNVILMPARNMNVTEMPLAA